MAEKTLEIRIVLPCTTDLSDEQITEKFDEIASEVKDLVNGIKADAVDGITFDFEVEDDDVEVGFEGDFDDSEE